MREREDDSGEVGGPNGRIRWLDGTRGDCQATTCFNHEEYSCHPRESGPFCEGVESAQKGDE